MQTASKKSYNQLGYVDNETVEKSFDNPVKFQQSTYTDN